VDPDRLVRLALAESVASSAADAAETDHVNGCALCRDELDSLRAVTELARQTQDLAEIPAPPERVWHRIAEATVAPTANTRPARTPTIPIPSSRHLPRWSRDALVGAAAAVIAVLSTLGVVRATDRPQTPPPVRIAATAQLAALPTAPSGSQGVARVLGDGTGDRLHLHVTGLPLRPGYYEVWLINPDTKQMLSIGTLRDGGDELLPLPSTLDLREYRLVDVSAEDFDGNALHSGQSLLRGTLSG
jgi:hypothetical protein